VACRLINDGILFGREALYAVLNSKQHMYYRITFRLNCANDQLVPWDLACMHRLEIGENPCRFYVLFITTSKGG